MNQKIKIKNIIVSSSIIIAIGLLVVFDHQRMTDDFINLRADLMRIRFETITENNSVIVEFNVNKVSALDRVLPAGTHSSIFLGAAQA